MQNCSALSKTTLGKLAPTQAVKQPEDERDSTAK